MISQSYSISLTKYDKTHVKLSPYSRLQELTKSLCEFFNFALWQRCVCLWRCGRGFLDFAFSAIDFFVFLFHDFSLLGVSTGSALFNDSCFQTSVTVRRRTFCRRYLSSFYVSFLFAQLQWTCWFLATSRLFDVCLFWGTSTIHCRIKVLTLLWAQK